MPGVHRANGVQSAVALYDGWCIDGKTPLNKSLSYQNMLLALPVNESLMLEALRALQSTLINVVQSATVCTKLEAKAANHTPRVGGCSNLLLDDFTGDFAAAYQQ